MATSDRVRVLAALLRETGRAHHQAFLDVNGGDPEWPIWYAEHLHERLAGIFEKSLTKSEITYLLVAAEREQAARNPGADWPEFYARFILEHHR